jgi:thiamine-phosphate pyrophosphorylase
MTDEQIPPRLYLITPPLSAVAPFDAALKAALDGADVACVLLRFATMDPGQRKTIAKALIPIAQGADAALLVDDDPQLAARSGADGAHVSGFSQALQDAIDSLKPDRIVGVGALENRDECMNAGESDIDYLMFGAPDDEEPAETIRERAQWWAEIFNVPCVAYARSLADVDALARTGAEFVALEAAIWDDPRGPAAAVADAARRCAGALA